MAVYKVTDVFDEGANFYVKFYAYTPIPAPAGPATFNSANVAWRTVVAELRAQRDDMRIFSMPPPAGITVAQLDAGEFYVWSHFVRVPKPTTEPEVEAAIVAEVLTVQAAQNAAMMARLAYWGKTGDTG